MEFTWSYWERNQMPWTCIKSDTNVICAHINVATQVHSHNTNQATAHQFPMNPSAHTSCTVQTPLHMLCCIVHLGKLQGGSKGLCTEILLKTICTPGRKHMAKTA